ncbi:MAG: DUF2065 domain-containing protein [Magnetospiraceae bacterium]
MTELLAALGLALAIEGMLYALFPAAMKRMMMQVLATPLSSLRGVGLSAAAIGVVIVWLAHG